MNHIEKLIQELCPDGVPFQRLSDLGALISGLSGRTKVDFGHGDDQFVTYKQVFASLSVDFTKLERVDLSDGKKQNKLTLGDVLFTASSENLDEVGMSSVITRQPESDLYLNSFCFAFRLKDERILDPEFSKYLFRAPFVRKQIIRSAQGVTRINISKKRFLELEVPIPPLEVQREIVKILDLFTKLEAKLEAELEAELEARRKQYEYYRDQLLTFPEDGGATWVELGEIGKIDRGNGMPRTMLKSQGVGAIHYGQIYTHYGRIACETVSFVAPDDAAKLTVVEPGDVIITNTSENLEDVCSTVAWLGEESIVIGGHSSVIRSSMDSRFLAYWFRSTNFFSQKYKLATGTKVIDISANKLKKVVLPVPPIEVQREVADVLDKFDALVNDLSSGLPAEIEARRKQYEYYRDKLLTFKELQPEAA